MAKRGLGYYRGIAQEVILSKQETIKGWEKRWRRKLRLPQSLW